jgi:hypothetical protein
MIKVDAIYGDDNSEDVSNVPLKSLVTAIEKCKSGDTIFLQHGTYEDFQITSSKNIFELTMSGVGNNSICVSSSFNGFFDINYNDIKIDSFKINSHSSNFRFKNVRFVTLNVMDLYDFENVLCGNSKTYITFENCRFDYNFQITVHSGDYNISIKSCEITGKLPLIYAKKGDITLRISNTDFEHSLLKVGKVNAEIQHIGCNFPPDIPLYIGNECIVKTRDNNFINTPLPNSISQLFGRVRSDSNINEPKDKGSQNESISSSVYLKELYGAISISSNDFEELEANRYTKIIHVKDNGIFNITLPKEADNGHILTIISELKYITVDNIKYTNRIIIFGWIYDYGWLKIN